MANKKNRRRNAAQRSTAPAPATPVALATSAAGAKAEQVAVPRKEELAGEYRYVYSDLKRIAILAAAMFALLVVLALAAQYVL